MNKNKKLYLPLLLLVIFSMVLSACGTAAAPATTIANPPTLAVATEVPPTAVPAKPQAAAVDWVKVWGDFLTNAPTDFYTIQPDVLNAHLTAGNAPFLIDVREPSEIQANGYIKGAINLPLRSLLQNLDKLPSFDKPIVIYCTSGQRAAMAMTALQLLGYTNTRSLHGGFVAWTAVNLPVEKSTPAAPVAGTAASVDPARLADLNTFLSSLPASFDAMKDTDALLQFNAATPPIVIDVRTADEFKASHIQGAVNIPLSDLLKDMTKLPIGKTTTLIVYGSTSNRGAIAVMALHMVLGYSANDIAGGTSWWAADRLPMVSQ